MIIDSRCSELPVAYSGQMIFLIFVTCIYSPDLYDLCISDMYDLYLYS